MTTTFWPGSNIERSTGNGFDLAARRARGPSIFYNPARTPAEAGKMGGALSASTVDTVKGLSERARSELNKAPKSITISNPADAARRTRTKRASI